MFKKRPFIYKCLWQVWQDVIFDDYMSGRINSEHGLQAVLYARLRNLLPDDRGIMVEPSLKVNGQIVIPDIVITWKQNVVAVVELKYKPKGTAKYLKDVTNMDLIAGARDGMRLDHHRLLGVENVNVSYKMSPSILFVWAGIHRPERNQSEYLYANGYPELDDCFMEMHAETQAYGEPEVYLRY